MTGDEPNSMDARKIAPDELPPSDCHVRRTHEPPDDQLIASVETVGVIHPPIGREEDGIIRLIDGVRRAKAAAEANIEQIPVLVRDLNDTEARAQSMTLNSDPGTANNKRVTDEDRERALEEAAAAKGKTVHEVEREIGLLSEADRIERALESTHGIGRSIAEKLADRWTLDELRKENVRLQSVPGIGEQTAVTIHQALQDPARN